MDDTFSISSFPSFSEFETKIDQRIKPYLTDWQLKTIYHGEKIDIPGHPNSRFDPIKYFQVIKKPGDPLYSEDERDNEIGLTLWAHWPGYDHECEVNLFISGKGVKDKNNYKVSAEITKNGGADMKLYWNNKFLTDFTQKVYQKVSSGWWSSYKLQTIENAKVWIDDLAKL